MAIAKRRFISFEEGRPAKGQHKKPCSDCPFARTALNGWLAGLQPEEWMLMASGETRIECHTLWGAQCAGSAIFRTNICKAPRDSSLLLLPENKELVFFNAREFVEHHRKAPMAAKKKTKSSEPDPVLKAEQQVMVAFDIASDPTRMSPEQVISLLNLLIGSFEIRLEAAMQELKEGEDRENG